MTFLTDSANVFLYAGMLGVVLFTVAYGTRSRWYRYPEGRALFAKSLSLTLVSGLSAMYIAFGENYPGRTVLRFVVYLIFALMSWYLTGTLLWSQHKGREKERELVREYHEAKAAEQAAAEGQEVVRVQLVDRRRAWSRWRRPTK